ncbi:MAG: regulator of sigma E protease [Candidatus Latescibacterota bacterium]
MITTILTFIVVLSILVFVHELGHFLVAKKSGMKVEEFSLGYPPKAVGIKIGETEYCLSWLPLGGYVKIAGMADFGHEESKGEPWEFQSKPRWIQMSVMIAGPFMNFLLGFLLLFGLRLSAGEYEFLNDTRVGEVKEASPLYDAGLLPGDRILSVGSMPITDWEEMSDAFITHMGKTVAIAVERETNQVVLTVDLTNTPEGLGIGPYMTTEVGATMPGMPAQEIALQPGDIITSVASVPVTMWWEMSREISKRPNEAIEITWMREKTHMSASITPEGQEEGEKTIGRIGINTASKRTPISFGKAFFRSGDETIRLSTAIFGFVKRLVVGQESSKQLAGPVGIFQMVGQQAERGFSHLIWFMAMLSINLGVLNLLPIPMLDGGHLLILSIETIARRDLSSRHKEILQQVGFVFLLFLIIYVTVNDIGRLFG